MGSLPTTLSFLECLFPCLPPSAGCELPRRGGHPVERHDQCSKSVCRISVLNAHFIDEAAEAQRSQCLSQVPRAKCDKELELETRTCESFLYIPPERQATVHAVAFIHLALIGRPYWSALAEQIMGQCCEGNPRATNGGSLTWGRLGAQARLLGEKI